ncbi:MAG: NAD(P)H-hydrate epimerase [Gemmatimonadetes bacterium]|nr:NAD(P)H-hydrate epimerase [Gemmatimonadota bacterium]
MIEDFHIDLIQMMENAGRNLAHLARERFLSGDPRGRRVHVLAGTGGNGGGAMVCARRLHCWGADVLIVVAAEDAKFSPVTAHQLDIARRMGISVGEPDTLTVAGVDLIIDGLIGYSLNGKPRGAVADIIRWVNRQSIPVLALDVPSGIDADTGAVYDPAIVATATMTLALPKEGLMAPSMAASIGELYLADISVPPGLYAASPLSLDIGPLFARGEILRLS